jgi:hypothetical protein
MCFFCEWKQISAGFYWLSIPVFSLEIQLSDGVEIQLLVTGLAPPHVSASLQTVLFKILSSLF